LSAAAISLVIASTAQAAVPATCPGPEDAAFGPVTTTTGTFDASMENSYVQVPFTVPAGTTGVRVRYCFDQPDIPLPQGLNNNTLDLGIYDPLQPGNTILGPDELRGWSGGAVRDATVAVNGFSSEAVYEAAPKGYVSGRTTRAYEPGPIPQGEWVAELGLAAISTTTEGNLDNSVAWRVDVQTTSSPAFADDPYAPAAYDSSAVRGEPGWYAGDFHVHGEHEPGNALMRETFDYAFAPVAEGGAGLDFVELVDHNNTVAYGEIGKLQGEYSDNLISRGTEVTTYRGHTNSLAASAAVDYRTAPIYRRAGDGTLTQVRAARPASEIFDQVHAAGGFTQINHPTIFPSQIPLLSAFCRGCPWDYTPAQTDYSKVDAIEVQTGPPGLDQPPRPGPNPFTPLAIRFWDEAIDDGGPNSNHIAATGSSDSHQAGDQGSGADSILASPVGEATTVVFADELSETAVQEGVEAGHTYVKPFGQTGPDVRLTAAENGIPMTPAMIGDTLQSATGFSATFTATVQNLDEARAARPGLYFVAVYRDALPVLTLPIAPSGDEFSFDFPALGYARYRLQVQREGAIETVSSPIYVEPVSGEPPPPPEHCKDAPAIRLGDGDERFDGTPAPDRVAGRRGADRIRGADGDDCLSGGRGRDRVKGDAGEDVLRGGGGSDRIRAQDGEVDVVRCGTGQDRARVDSIDTATGCEKVVSDLGEATSG
jgi:Ca2+-binding RTX toxin-like protein